MNILCLYPQVQHFQPLGTYSFIAEEMVALARLKGIVMLGISALRSSDFNYEGIDVKSVPGLRSSGGELARDIKYFVRNRSFFPSPRAVEDILRVWQCCRVERFIEKTAARNSIDIIHSHGIWPESSGGSLAAARMGIKLLLTVRGGEILVAENIGHGRALDPFHRKLISNTLARSDRIIGVSRAICDRAIEMGAAPDKVTRIAKGVDVDRFRPGLSSEEIRQRFQEVGRPVVLSVGGLTRRKGFDECLRALALLRQRGGNFYFVAIGEGPEEKNLRSLAAGLGIADRVFFAGKVSREEIAGYYGGSDIFCLAALQDAAPNVILEAMAAGLPVVSTLAGGIPEYVSAGETGFLVPPGDVPALAEQLERLIGDEEMRRRMGRAGRERAVGEFPYGKMIGRIAEEYRNLISNRR